MNFWTIEGVEVPASGIIGAKDSLLISDQCEGSFASFYVHKNIDKGDRSYVGAELEDRFL
jgi:hypothetical protein